MNPISRIRPCIRKSCKRSTTELFCKTCWAALPHEQRQEMIRVRDQCRAAPSVILEEVFHRLLLRAVAFLEATHPAETSSAPADQPSPAGAETKEGA